jgi:three-Cys-motif partner protein
MLSLEDYKGREQSYVKHIFLARYLEALVHKTASVYPHIVYVDGFAGPWRSANVDFHDTSFGIALNALRKAKASWKAMRDVKMSAILVERDPEAYTQLANVSNRFPEITVKTYAGDFLSKLSEVVQDIPANAFAFFFIDPKGWRVRLRSLEPLLLRPNSEVIFNFMFDFINRAASIKDATVMNGLDELMPYGDFRGKLAEAEKSRPQGIDPNERKTILVEAFRGSLVRLGHYKYVAETTVLRPLRDRPLYCLFYATRHPKGIEVFRECQIKALAEQSTARAATKVMHVERNTGQRELFQSLHDMGPDDLTAFLSAERVAAECTLLALTPQQPNSILYENLWPQVLSRHVVRLPDVNRLAARLRADGALLFPDWMEGRRVPQPSYRTQRR